MARLHAALLMLALSSASATEGFEGSDSDRKALAAEVACTSITDQRACCGAIDSRDSLDGFNPTATEKYCVPAKSGTTFTSSNGDHVCEPVCAVNGKGCAAADADQAAKDAWAGSDQTAKIYSCWIQTTVAATTAAPAAPATTVAATTTPATTTTTYTPWDSSASSSDSDTLDSAYSSSFKEYQESSKSSAESSWESSGSDASGSGGSYMHFWQWGLILGALAVCCCAVCAAMAPKPKPKKPKTPPKPQPEPEPVQVEEPMPELAPLMPVTTSYVQQPTTTYVQQPMTYVQQPMTYAQATPAAYVV